jgi:general secretion pathway protein D
VKIRALIALLALLLLDSQAAQPTEADLLPVPTEPPATSGAGKTGAPDSVGETGQSTREETRTKLLRDVDRGWERPAPSAAPASERPLVAPGNTLQRKLEAIVLPQVSFTRAEIGQVVATLSAASETYDRAEAAPKGVNIILLDAEARRPHVTIVLRHTTLKRALDFITESIGYQYEVQADAVVVRPGGEHADLRTDIFPVSLATVVRLSGRSTKPSSGAGKSAGGEGHPGTADIADVKAFFQQAGISFTGEGTGLAYDGTALIVTQSPRNLARIRNLLVRYRDVRQVEIEAKFMEVQEGALDELGVQWNVSRRGVPQVDPATGVPIRDANGRQVFLPQESYTTGGVTRSLAGAFPTSTNNPAITIDAAAAAGPVIDGVPMPGTPAESRVIPVAPPAIPGSVALGNGASAFGSITGFVGEFDVAAVIRALAQKQGTDLLSSPRVTVLSGHAATITVAQELRYPQSYGEIQSQVGSGSGNGTGISAAGVTVTAGTPQEFATRNVGVELKVTPTVEDDDRTISLDLNPKVTEFEGFVEYGGPSIAISSGVTVKVPPGFYQPIFSVRDMSTRVTLWDGATLVMGGLTREEVKKVHDKVPILGDIPLLGRLFRSQGESSQKRNLLIFVTATLVTPGGAPLRAGR